MGRSRALSRRRFLVLGFVCNNTLLRYATLRYNVARVRRSSLLRDGQIVHLKRI